MEFFSRWRVAERTKAAIAPVLLFVAAMIPAIDLYQSHIRHDLEGAHETLMIVVLSVLVATVVLFAVLLWHARFRIIYLEAKEAEALQHAGVDPLSGLPNRLLFDRLLENALLRASPAQPLGLFVIDIDRFKSVNDSHGHQAGDRLIVGVAERIKEILRDGDCLARIGGDELAVMLMNIGGMEQCAAFARRIRDAMMLPFDIGRAQVLSTVSLGIALAPQDGESRPTLFQAADLALYRAKEEGRNRFAFFDKTMEQKLYLGMTIEDDLRHAINNNELSVVYQPLVTCDGENVIGVEALVRWHHPRLGTMSPEEFIPVAENRGLIGPLGEWVLNRACRDGYRWPHLRVAINVSPVQFRQPNFVKTVERIIADSGIDPARLDLELTEGVLIQDADQAENIILDLRGLGVRMVLDDFGSGYSSMIYLRRFAFDKIKIDRAFLGTLETTGESAIILDSIVSLGHALGLTVTAEGVEHADQVAFLRKLGCDELQGFYFAHPLLPEEIDGCYDRLAARGQTRAAPTVTDFGGMPNRDAA